MNLDQVERIAAAVLYEGYMLYPYRPSSVKNQQRWNFGVLCPPDYSERQNGLEPCEMQTVCLLRADSETRVTVKVRFLQIVQRTVGRLRELAAEGPQRAESDIELVDRLELAGKVYQPWQEAVEREICLASLDPACRISSPIPFSFSAGRSFEYVRDGNGMTAGVIAREWKTLSGSVQMKAERCRNRVTRLTIRVHNLTFGEISANYAGREEVLLHSLVSAHTILGVENGEFISLLDPPEDLTDLAAQCRNVGTWPVLAGNGTEAMLSSPIILYDHPQIAPESAGDLFDATEIDEILSLRILTLTDEEKREMRQSDERTRGILERTECMPEEQFMKLHGVLRGLSPAKEEAR